MPSALASVKIKINNKTEINHAAFCACVCTGASRHKMEAIVKPGFRNTSRECTVRPKTTTSTGSARLPTQCNSNWLGFKHISTAYTNTATFWRKPTTRKHITLKIQIFHIFASPKGSWPTDTFVGRSVGRSVGPSSFP